MSPEDDKIKCELCKESNASAKDVNGLNVCSDCLRQQKELIEHENIRFKPVVFDETSKSNVNVYETSYDSVRKLILGGTRPSREQSLALTKLEESFMWVREAVRYKQIVDIICDNEL